MHASTAAAQVRRRWLAPDQAVEMPSVAPRASGRRHRHAYMLGSRVTGAGRFWGAPQVRTPPLNPNIASFKIPCLCGLRALPCSRSGPPGMLPGELTRPLQHRAGSSQPLRPGCCVLGEVGLESEASNSQAVTTWAHPGRRMC